jgi:hypothetical protein
MRNGGWGYPGIVEPERQRALRNRAVARKGRTDGVDEASKTDYKAGASPAQRTLFERINQPLAVTVIGGLLVFVISAFIQDRYWIKQQRFSARQVLISKTIDAATASESEIVDRVGKLISSYALIVGAHEHNLSEAELEEDRQKFNRMQLDWDVSEDLLKLKLRLYFASPQVQKEWQKIEDLLATLDEEIAKLFAIPIAERSSKHQKSLEECRSLITKTEAALADLGSSMDASIRASVDSQ